MYFAQPWHVLNAQAAHLASGQRTGHPWRTSGAGVKRKHCHACRISFLTTTTHPFVAGTHYFCKPNRVYVLLTTLSHLWNTLVRLSFAIHRLDTASRAGKVLAFLALASCFLWMDTECRLLGMSRNQLLLLRAAAEAVRLQCGSPDPWGLPPRW